MDPWPRYEAERFRVGAFYFEAYRRDDRLGVGPCLSVHRNTDDLEVWRFDLFDPPHMHFNQKDGDCPRIFFPAGPLAQQIDRACWEIENNQLAAFASCRDQSLRKSRLDQKQLERVLPAVRKSLARWA